MTESQRITLKESTIKRLSKYRQEFQSPDDVINIIINKLENRELPILTNKAKKPKSQKAKSPTINDDIGRGS